MWQVTLGYGVLLCAGAACLVGKQHQKGDDWRAERYLSWLVLLGAALTLVAGTLVAALLMETREPKMLFAVLPMFVLAGLMLAIALRQIKAPKS